MEWHKRDPEDFDWEPTPGMVVRSADGEFLIGDCNPQFGECSCCQVIYGSEIVEWAWADSEYIAGRRP